MVSVIPVRSRGLPGAAAAAIALIVLCGAPAPAPRAGGAAPEPSVSLRDLGWPNRCAEMDNVLVALEADAPVARFAIRARHPVYAPTVRPGEASHAADFTDCAFEPEPIWHYEPESHLLHEDAAIRLDGHRLPKSWRPEEVPVTVGGRTWTGLHLLQLRVKRPSDGLRDPAEILVLYPSDGYWRPTPLPRDGGAQTPFGASVIVGPVEIDRRPLVRLSAVRFDPAAMAFDLDFALGGRGRVRVASAGPDELRLEVSLDPAVSGLPFALASSMFVAEDNADLALMRLRTPDRPFWTEHPVIGFGADRAAEVALVRDVPSRHNTLAPDLILGPFARD